MSEIIELILYKKNTLQKLAGLRQRGKHETEYPFLIGFCLGTDANTVSGIEPE